MSETSFNSECPSGLIVPFASRTTRDGLRVACYALPLDRVPADFFADPDGQWTFEALAKAAGFSPGQGVAVGALRAAFNGHPEGAAVVTLNSDSRPHIAIIECPIAFDVVVRAGVESSAA
jgi:hypothetical protein